MNKSTFKNVCNRVEKGIETNTWEQIFVTTLFIVAER